MESILKNDNEMRVRLSTFIQNLLPICKSSEFPEDARNEIQNEEMFARYEDNLEDISKELLEEECPVVIIGETSAGKSTLINVLIGHEILPSSTLRCTNAVCRLRRGQGRQVHMTRKDGTMETFSFNDDKGMKNKIKSLFIENGTNLKSIDIFISAPILQGHVTIVDTPGFGDNEDNNNDLFEYLPKAIACIYVIKTDNAGGLQADRLQKVWKYQVEWNEKNKREFNSHLMIFVCNAWDQIEEDEEEEVLGHILNTLKEVWKDFKDEQLLTLSAKEEMALMRKGEKPSYKFEHLEKRIQELVPGCLKAKIERHQRYVSVLLEKINKQIEIKRGDSAVTYENVLRDMKKNIRVSEMFGDMISKDSELKQIVFTHIYDEYKELARRASEHLCGTDIKENILKECDHVHLSVYKEWEMLEKACVSLIYNSVNNAIDKWSTDNRIKNRWLEIKGRILGEFSGNTDGETTKLDFLAGHCRKDEHEEQDQSKRSLFSTGEMIGLVAVCPLLLPVGIVASGPALMIGTAVMIHEKKENARKIQNFHENRQTIMSTCLDNMLEKIYSEDDIYDRFERIYIRVYVEHWEELKKDIEAHHSRMKVNDQKASRDVDVALENYNSLKNFSIPQLKKMELI